MVDFPEGYGFAPNESKWLVQEQFVVSVGTYERKPNNPTLYRSRVRGPWAFVPIGHVVKNDEQSIYGYMMGDAVSGSRFTGTLQEICIAMCTAHRMTRR